MNISFKNNNIPDIHRYNDNIVNYNSTKKTILADSINVGAIDSMILIGVNIITDPKFSNKDTIKFIDKNLKFLQTHPKAQQWLLCLGLGGISGVAYYVYNAFIKKSKD